MKRYKTDRIRVERALEEGSFQQSHTEIYAHKQRNRKYHTIIIKTWHLYFSRIEIHVQ